MIRADLFRVCVMVVSMRHFSSPGVVRNNLGDRKNIKSQGQDWDIAVGSCRT